MSYTILASNWRNTMFACIGIVAVETYADEWKAYINVCRGDNQQADEQFVAGMGAPLLPEEAHGFFPSLDITHYKKEG